MPFLFCFQTHAVKTQLKCRILVTQTVLKTTSQCMFTVSCSCKFRMVFNYFLYQQTDHLWGQFNLEMNSVILLRSAQGWNISHSFHNFPPRAKYCIWSKWEMKIHRKAGQATYADPIVAGLSYLACVTTISQWWMQPLF